jgi:hypothetical protein
MDSVTAWLDSLKEKGELLPFEDDVAGDVYEQGREYYDRHNFVAALEKFEEAYTVAHAELGETGDHTMDMLTWVAETLAKLGRYNEALARQGTSCV